MYKLYECIFAQKEIELTQQQEPNPKYVVLRFFSIGPQLDRTFLLVQNPENKKYYSAKPNYECTWADCDPNITIDDIAEIHAATNFDFYARHFNDIVRDTKYFNKSRKELILQVTNPYEQITLDINLMEKFEPYNALCNNPKAWLKEEEILLVYNITGAQRAWVLLSVYNLIQTFGQDVEFPYEYFCIYRETKLPTNQQRFIYKSNYKGSYGKMAHNILRFILRSFKLKQYPAYDLDVFEEDDVIARQLNFVTPFNLYRM